MTNWPLYRSVAYLRGRGVTFGSPVMPPQETNTGAYSVVMDTIHNGRTSIMGKAWDLFSDNSLDHIFLGPRLECIQDQEGFLRDAARRLRIGGHLVVYVNVNRIEPGLFPLCPVAVDQMISRVGRWQRKQSYLQDGQSLQIYKRLKGTSGIVEGKLAPSLPRACVVRFGALGDAIILTPVLKALHDQGYHVTFMGTPYCAPALENNPYIDNLLLQERDAVPNQELGQYWSLWSKDYDRYINLSESLEGDLLIVEGRKEFFTTKEWRHSRCNKNYYEYTLERSGVTDVSNPRGELYFTNAEERRAREFWQGLQGKFVILWALNGSSHHKVYPMMETVLRKFLGDHPEARAVTVGDDMARLLEFEHPQLIERAGKWSIRESLIATKYASVVVGPETMITNAAGCFSTPKITILSHSSHENLCKHWENDYCVAPDQEIAPCYPCHMLHYSKESCPTGVVEDTETGEEMGRAPICPIAVLPQRLYARLEEVYSNHYLQVKAA